MNKKRMLGVALVGAALTIPAAALATTASADPVDNTATAQNVDWDNGWHGDNDWNGDNGWHGHHHHHHWFRHDFDWDDDSFGSASGVVNGLETIVDGVIEGFGQIVGSAG